MNTLVFAYPENDSLANALSAANAWDPGVFALHQFPDGETLVRIDSDAKGKDVVIACSLHRPNAKVLPLYFLVRALRDQGAKRVWLVAPYLSYLRQDRQFHDGEGVTAKQFAAWLSSFLDGLVTVDAHLHRVHDLNEVYSIPTRNVSAAPAISAWVAQNVTSPVLVGPDSESEQWVSEVARSASCPFTVLEKTRRGDRDVEVSIPQLKHHRDRTPVLIDDIISTARTMIAAVKHLAQVSARRPVCIGVHAVFAGEAYNELAAAGAERIVTTNTIPHVSNAIDVHPIIAQGLADLA